MLPSPVALDPTKRYYISVLPGDAANPFIAGERLRQNGTSATQAQLRPLHGRCTHRSRQTAVNVTVLSSGSLPAGEALGDRI